jgi:hypothetical protein
MQRLALVVDEVMACMVGRRQSVGVVRLVAWYGRQSGGVRRMLGVGEGE